MVDTSRWLVPFGSHLVKFEVNLPSMTTTAPDMSLLHVTVSDSMSATWSSDKNINHVIDLKIEVK